MVTVRAGVEGPEAATNGSENDRIRPLHRVLITIDDARARRRPGAAVTVTKRRGACYIVGQLVRTQLSSSTPRYPFRSELPNRVLAKDLAETTLAL